MNGPEPSHPPAGSGTPDTLLPDTVDVGRDRSPGMTAGQRLLAGLIAAAVLASGLNACLQIAKAVTEGLLQRG